MPTNNPVPSTDPTDLLFNAQKLDQVVNGSAQYYTDRLGVNRRTVEGINAAADVVLGGLGYAPPVAYASGISLTLTTQTVEYAGEVYAPKVASLPFTTSTWATDSAKFRLIQGVAATDLAASGGAAMVGYDGGTVQDVLDGAKSLQDYTALRAYTGRAKRIYITGLLAAKKPAGIAGIFQYDPTDTTSADNGGTIIVGADGRRWKRDFSEAVNIMWFGALGNGIADDTGPMQAALNTRQAVMIPEGNYRVTSTLQYYSQQTVYGLGDKSQIKSEISGNVVFLNAEIVYNCNFHDFKILGTGSETGGIRVTEGYEGMRLSRVFVSNVGGKAFWFSKIYVVDCYDLWAEGNNVTEFGLFLEDVTTFNFYGCHFRECKKEGAGARLNKNTAENYVINFHGCIFESNYGDGLQIQSGNSVTVDGCYFEANAREYLTNNAFRANHISIKPFGAAGVTGGEYITVKNCYFNPNYVEHIIASTAAVQPLSIENNLERNFGIYPHQLVRYDADLTVSSLSRVQLIGHSPQDCNTHGKTGSLSATNHRYPQLDNIRLVYYNAAGTAIEGDVPATITSTRTMQGGSVKVCVFSISSIDTSGIDPVRLIAVIPPVNRFSSGQFTAALDHVGTSGTGVLGFYLRSDQSGNVFFLRKQRLTASGSSVGRAGDLVGVTELSGSIAYF